AGPRRILALELANLTRGYALRRRTPGGVGTICPGAVTENLPFAKVFWRPRRTPAARGGSFCFLPSYSPRQSLAALLAAKSIGIRTVMMNETHGGTARAARVGTWIKRRLVRLFDAALVGGQPQKRYFTALGLPEHRIFLGYDAV